MPLTRFCRFLRAQASHSGSGCSLVSCYLKRDQVCELSVYLCGCICTVAAFCFQGCGQSGTVKSGTCVTHCALLAKLTFLYSYHRCQSLTFSIPASINLSVMQQDKALCVYVFVSLCMCVCHTSNCNPFCS